MNIRLSEVNGLLDKIRSGQSGRDEVIVSLFRDKKLRNSFKKMFRNEGWRAEEIETILTDAIVTFASSVIRRKDFELSSDLYNYILVIGKRAYMKSLQKGNLFTHIDEDMENIADDEMPLELVIQTEQSDLMQMLLSKLARNCREVLTYWASHYSMKEIAEKMDYKSDMMARKKKYKCLNELISLLEEHPEIKQLLKR